MVDHILLKEAMKHLEQKEQQMICCRYFEGKNSTRNCEDLFHISQVQVSRIENLKKLRTNDWKYLKNYARIKKTLDRSLKDNSSIFPGKRSKDRMTYEKVSN